MNTINNLSMIIGNHQIFVNSKIPLTEAQVRRYVSRKYPVKIRVEGPRVLWDDVKEFIGVHICIFVFTCGVSLFGYLGFYLYEKWKPLYIVKLEVGNQLKIEDWEIHMNPSLYKNVP